MEKKIYFFEFYVQHYRDKRSLGLWKAMDSFSSITALLKFLMGIATFFKMHYLTPVPSF